MATTSYRVGDSPFYTNTATDGIELNGILKGRFALAAGAVKHKDQKNLSGYGSIHYKLGGADFEGHETPLSLDAEESILDYLTVTLGGYGYAGCNNPGANQQLNNFYRYGFEADARYKRFRAKLATAFGNDDNPVITSGFPDGLWIEKKSKVYAAEVLYLFGSEIIPSLRYEYEDNGSFISRRVIPTIAYAALQNAKLVLEYKWEHISKDDDNTLNLGLTVSF